jgi:peptide deformylase
MEGVVMVKDIVKDEDVLSQKCERVNAKEDISQIVQDLIDTAEFYKERCIGLAANQIGYHKRVIVVRSGNSWEVFVNPVVMGDKLRGKFESEEECLSLDGSRTVTRYNRITFLYQDLKGKSQKISCRKPYSVVLQHETDHTNGILI